ncbi:MAG TPA: J domain-containing protein [Terracidiphilus sp.]|nr:J domain-containing protein [Terracidiphilus sp.]
MTHCSCGNVLDQDDALCARCRALQTLGLDAKTATREDIQNVYRVLVKVWHPDRFQSDSMLQANAEEKLKSINAAYEFLQSPAAEVRPPQGNPVHEAPPVDFAHFHPQTALADIEAAHQPDVEGSVISNLMMRVMVLVCILIMAAVAVVAGDSYLSTNPETASAYEHFKGELSWGAAVAKTKAVSNVSENWKNKAGQGSVSAASTSSSGDDPNAPSNNLSAASIPTPTTTPSPALTPSIPATIPVHIPQFRMPYVTVGLTRDEVAGVLGMPLLSTENVLEYPGAQFYLHNNLVTGWKIDSPAQLKHVWLAPDRLADARATGFTMGSPRSLVIAVQGTPTLLTENKLAFGRSEVFLEDGRVVGWNDNHASTRLRVISHRAQVASN